MVADFVKTTVAEPACRMEYNKFNAATPHPAYIVPRPPSSAHNISLRADMASRRGVSKRPASSEGKWFRSSRAWPLGTLRARVSSREIQFNGY